MSNEKNNRGLTPEEEEILSNFMTNVVQGEMLQTQDLIENCHDPRQFANTHSAYLKDWEKTNQHSEEKLQKGILPPGTSVSLYRAIINASDEVNQRKLEIVRDAFQKKFGESIYNYLGSDGKTKKLFGLFG